MTRVKNDVIKNHTNFIALFTPILYIFCKFYDEKNNFCDEKKIGKIVENPEHVPLLVVTPQSPNSAAYKHSSDTANFPSNFHHLTNGNGLIENSDQHQLIRPMQTVTLSSGTPAIIMRSRLNQYKTNSKKSTIVSIDDDNGTTTTVNNNNNNQIITNNKKGNKMKKKKSQKVDI